MHALHRLKNGNIPQPWLNDFLNQNEKLERISGGEIIPWKCWLSLQLYWSWPNSDFFENVSASYHIKEMNIFKKLATTKRTARSLGLIWVLFSRHILERVFERAPCWRFVPASVYFLYWRSSEVISEKDAERKGINERTGVIFFVLSFRALHRQLHGRKFGTMWVAAWLQILSCSDSQGTDRLSPPLRNPQMMSLWPFKQKAWAPYGDF